MVNVDAYRPFESPAQLSGFLELYLLGFSDLCGGAKQNKRHVALILF